MVTDRLADLLWTPSIDGNENLKAEGIAEDRIELVGNIMIDAFELQRPQIARLRVAERFGLGAGEYGVVTLHRPSNVDSAESLQRAFPVRGWHTSLAPAHPLRQRALDHQACEAGLAWQWDGVQFEFLHPTADELAREAKPNAVSCVLRVADAVGRSVLLAGDIETPQEAALAQRLGERLRSDLLLVPSLYEPCGLTQMYAMRYGTVPVVRQTGGLADTVTHFDPATGEGTGSVFRDADVGGLSWGLNTAFDWYAERPTWRRLIGNCMAQDFSWDAQGAQYMDLYERLVSP